MAKKTVACECAVCGKVFQRLPYEVKRNAKLGRANLCGRHCHAIWMDYAPAKQSQTLQMLAERNSDQYRQDNPNWRGGSSSEKHKPLPDDWQPKAARPAEE